MDKDLLKNLLAKHSTNQEIPAGKDIFNYQESADKVYLILQGLVRLFIKDKEGTEQEVARLTSGSLLGELAFLEEGNRTSRATAYEDTKLMTFSPKKLKNLIYKRPTLKEKVITSLCNRISRLQEPEVELPELANSSKKEEPKEDEAALTEEQAEPPPEVSDFYLSGHAGYSESAPDKFNHYLYTKDIDCPVCSTETKVKKIRNSRLKLKEVRDDLRPLYKEFKPSWYKIWICPVCFYTARRNDFFDFRASKRKKIKKSFKDRIQASFGSNYQPGYSQPRKLEEVFTAYYLALNLYEFIGTSKNKIAYLWLRLNWLYEDVGEEELAYKASFKALEYLRESYFKGDNNPKLSRQKRDKKKLLLALLFYKHDLGEEALPLLDDLIRSPQTNRRYKQLARDKFMAIREERRKKQ